jgi:GNAT superfamily N-acetyltransferase
MSDTGSVLTIRRIDANDTRELRWQVLRPGRPFTETQFEADDLAVTVHVGAFLDEQVVSVASLTPRGFPADPLPGDWQLRGMATAGPLQGHGYGTDLLHECLRMVREQGALRVWCHGRVGALRFYERFGFRRVGEAFMHPVSGPHFVLIRDL